MPEAGSNTRSTASRPAPTALQRRLPRLGRERRIGIEPHRLLAGRGPRALDPLDVALRVRQRDLLLHVVPERRLLALQLVEHLVREHLVDGPHAVRPLRVAGTGVVLEE